MILTPTTWYRALLRAAGKKMPRYTASTMYQGLTQLHRDARSEAGRK